MLSIILSVRKEELPYQQLCSIQGNTEFPTATLANASEDSTGTQVTNFYMMMTWLWNKQVL